MSLSTDFDQAASLAVSNRFRNPRKRPPPFSIRLSEEDRARLAVEAAGAPLGAYIKAKLLGVVPSGRMRRKGLPIQDREAHVWKSSAIRATSPESLQQNLSPDGGQFFWIDDAWGSKQ